MSRLGEHLIGLLEAYGIDTVFGIPGVHTIELYRGLAGSRIRHVTPRHEQAAGFMADGYARATGRVAACVVITGPGLTNILTAMAQAYADSVPMLVISSVTARGAMGLGTGTLHELRDQQALAAGCAAFSHTILDPETLPRVLARAFAVFESARPRPVHIEIPVDVLTLDSPPLPSNRRRLSRPVAAASAVNDAADLLNAAEAPVILAGGGAIDAEAILRHTAEILDAPVVTTVNARGLMGRAHALDVPASPSLAAVRQLIDGADTVLVVGSEIGPTDYDMYGRASFRVRGPVIRIDIDPEQIARGLIPTIGLVGDAAATLRALADRLLARQQAGRGAARAEAANRAAIDELGPAMRLQRRFLAALTEAAHDVPIVGDSTVAVYAGNLYHAAPAPRRWFNAATGYGALGYGLPAANGAAIATGRPVICLTGDGGLQFSLAELGTTAQENLAVAIVVWNNRGYAEIKAAMLESGVTPVGVDLLTPDFVGLARAYGIRASRPADWDSLFRDVSDAVASGRPSLIEVDEAMVMR